MELPGCLFFSVNVDDSRYLKKDNTFLFKVCFSCKFGSAGLDLCC